MKQIAMAGILGLALVLATAVYTQSAQALTAINNPGALRGHLGTLRGDLGALRDILGALRGGTSGGGGGCGVSCG